MPSSAQTGFSNLFRLLDMNIFESNCEPRVSILTVQIQLELLNLRQILELDLVKFFSRGFWLDLSFESGPIPIGIGIFLFLFFWSNICFFMKIFMLEFPVLFPNGGRKLVRRRKIKNK
jgi:hypothetical protein